MEHFNNSDTISRQAAIELAMEYCPDDDGSVGKLGDLRELLDELENLPSAQKKGEWIEREDPFGFFDTIPVCSECGCTTKMRERYNYCPNCGARMESE